MIQLHLTYALSDTFSDATVMTGPLRTPPKMNCLVYAIQSHYCEF